jgi:Asp-tRNA(Asn)/Glu-tRNA(Gln) amidotransferase A subunit family amidase
MPRTPSILSLSHQLRTGQISPADLVERCLARIKQFEPQIHAWVLVDAEGARTTAKQMAEELRRDRWRGPLHGIPIAIKDIIDVAGFPTLAGSPLRKEHRAERDATVVARLREAGAIILGKTVTTEFASFDPPPTLNPWNLAHTPGGSSSGSAAAVAMGMCCAAIGSQTGGSIIRPASYCGVAGCKPTYGRVSLSGIVPLAYHMDHPGPIAPSVADLAAVLDAIAGYDPHDPFSIDVPHANCVQSLGRTVPPRLGLIETFFMEEADESIRQTTLTAVEKLRLSGTRVESLNLTTDFPRIVQLHARIMAVEAADYHRATYGQHSDQYGPRIGSLVAEGLATSAVDYSEALRVQPQFRLEMIAVMHGFDALLTPATNMAAPTKETTGNPRFNSLWSYSGLPNVSFPCGLTPEGLPASLQFIGRPFAESPLMGAAAWCEKIVDFTEQPPLLGGF